MIVVGQADAVQADRSGLLDKPLHWNGTARGGRGGMDMKVDHHSPGASRTSRFFLNGNGCRRLGFFGLAGLSKIVIDLDLGPFRFRILFQDEPGGIPGRFATLQDQVGKMPAGSSGPRPSGASG